MEFIETIKDIQFLRGMFIRLRGMLYSLIPVIGGGVIELNAMELLFHLRLGFVAVIIR